MEQRAVRNLPEAVAYGQRKDGLLLSAAVLVKLQVGCAKGGHLPRAAANLYVVEVIFVKIRPFQLTKHPIVQPMSTFSMKFFVQLNSVHECTYLLLQLRNTFRTVEMVTGENDGPTSPLYTKTNGRDRV